MKISIRKFEGKDIPKKVEWINNSENNKYLHYDIPLKIEKTEKWFEKNKDRTDRFDAVIEADGVPCGTIGLLSIDQKNKKAEYYIAMGEISLKGKGVSTNASKLLLKYGIPLDSTYTGKAFQGMKKYIAENNIKNKNILFIHTGGTPLFFDDLRRM